MILLQPMLHLCLYIPSAEAAQKSSQCNLCFKHLGTHSKWNSTGKAGRNYSTFPQAPSPIVSSLAYRTCPEACLPISARLPPMPKAQLLISNSCTWVSASCKASPFCVNCISSVFMLSCSFPELPMAAWMGNKKASHWDSESWILVIYPQLWIFGNMPFQRL